MTIEDSRKWLVTASLGVIGFQFVFFLLAPALGYPLTYAQALRPMEIVLPVFLGYVGAATVSLFLGRNGSRPGQSPESRSHFSMLVRGPVVVFSLISCAALIAFGFSNRVGAPPGSGMSLDFLTRMISLSLGLLAVTTSAIVTYIFSLSSD